jgi:hypothetical protein
MFEFMQEYGLRRFGGNLLCLSNRMSWVQEFENTVSYDHHEDMVHVRLKLLKPVRTQMKILLALFKHDFDSPSQEIRSTNFSRRKPFANTSEDKYLTTAAGNYDSSFTHF